MVARNDIFLGFASVLLCLVLAVTACNSGELLDAVSSHPLADPELPFGEIESQHARTGDTSTGLSPVRLDTRAITRFEVPPDRLDEAWQVLRSQAEGLGYEFRAVNGDESFLRSGTVGAFPNVAIELRHSEKTVTLEVVGLRKDQGYID